MPENSTNRGYPLPVATDAFTPRAGINALGVAVDADVQGLADDVADASGIDDGAIGPAKLDRAYAESGNTFVRIGEDAGANIVSSTSVAIGKEALKTQAAPNDVIAIGEHTLEDGDAIGQGVIAIGGNAARTSSPGAYSTAVGYAAMEFAPDGVQNAVALGRAAQQRASKENAVAVGVGAQLRASGVHSVAVGSAAQSATILMQGGAEYTDLPLDSTRQYFITGTNLLIDGVAWPDGFFDFGTGEESSITADAGTLQVIVYQLDDDSAPSSSSAAGRTPSRDYHTVLGANSATDHTGGIALGYNAFADTDRQVQVGTAVEVNGVEPPNALRVGVHDAILTTDTPTTGEVLRFDGSAWVADGAATAAQGALADTAVQPGDLATVATTGDYSDLSGTPTLGTAAATDASAYATAAQGVKADAAAPAATIGNLLAPNVATGTDTLGTTTGFTAVSTLESSTEQAWQGSRSLKVTMISSNAAISIAGGSAYSEGDAIPILGGRTYTMSYWLYSAVGKALIGRVYWWKADGTAASTAITFAPAVTTAAEWRQGTVTAVAPTDAAFASLVILQSGTAWAAGEVYYLDGVTFHAGAGGSWAPPGVVINDAPTRVKPTDAAVMQLWNPSTSSWVDAAASSSVVFGTTAGTAAEGNDSRVVNAVQTSRQVATGSGLTGGGDLTADRTLAVDFTAVATAAQGALADSAVQVVGSPSVGDVIEWDGTQWVPAAASTGLLPRSATITGATPALAASSFAASYVAQFSGTVWSTAIEGAYMEFDVLLDAGTYDLTMVGSKNSIQAIATFTLDGSPLTTIDTYAASFTANNFMTVTGLAIPGGRHVLRLATPTRNASSTGWVLNVNAIQLVRTGA